MGQPAGLKVRCTADGFAASARAGRIGRGTRLPPQFLQVQSISCAHVAQNVHSKVQMVASDESGKVPVAAFATGSEIQDCHRDCFLASGFVR